MRMRTVMRWVVALQVLVGVIGYLVGEKAKVMVDAMHGTSQAALAQQAGGALMGAMLLFAAALAFTLLFFTAPAWVLTEIVCLLKWLRIRRGWRRTRREWEEQNARIAKYGS